MRERLAVGGVGEVWRAEGAVLDRCVAVKLLRPEHADNEEYRERLRLEGRHLAARSHPRLAGVYDYGDGPGSGAGADRQGSGGAAGRPGRRRMGPAAAQRRAG
ncbi:hypothetical protein GCM10023196_019550 [Actinoallomurus vinaceus]|uniref:Protein kinase domain-containing protein n=1 Tax=Actinoallomurus vinaceus TaxID=1080074 RepID=A0ABP8U772_9ACTN